MQTKDPMSKGGCFGGAGTIRRYPEVRLIPFALKWSQEKSSVTATLLQRAESEPETCCDSHICCLDLPRPGFGPQWNNTPPSSHCGRGQRGVTEECWQVEVWHEMRFKHQTKRRSSYHTANTAADEWMLPSLLLFILYTNMWESG